MLSFPSTLGGTSQVDPEVVVAVVDCEDGVWVIAPTPFTFKGIPGSFEEIAAQLPGMDPVKVMAGYGVQGESEVMRACYPDERGLVRRSSVTGVTTNGNATGSWLYFASVPKAILCPTGAF